MAVARSYIVHITSGTPRWGIWCDRCLTSAGVEIDMFHITASGVSLLATVRRCARCDLRGGA